MSQLQRAQARTSVLPQHHHVRRPLGELPLLLQGASLQTALRSHSVLVCPTTLTHLRVILASHWSRSGAGRRVIVPAAVLTQPKLERALAETPGRTITYALIWLTVVCGSAAGCGGGGTAQIDGGRCSAHAVGRVPGRTPRAHGQRYDARRWQRRPAARHGECPALFRQSTGGLQPIPNLDCLQAGAQCHARRELCKTAFEMLGCSSVGQFTRAIALVVSACGLAIWHTTARHRGACQLRLPVLEYSIRYGVVT